MARDIFAAYWSAVLLGALSRATPTFPFDAMLARYASETADDRSDLIHYIRDAGRFDDDVMAQADTEASWAPGGQLDGYDETLVGGLVSIMLGRPTDVDFSDLEQLRAVCQRAASHELARFFGAFMAATFVAGHPPHDGVRLLTDALPVLGRLLGQAAPPGDLIKLGYAQWCRDGLADAEQSPDARFREWVARARQLYPSPP